VFLKEGGTILLVSIQDLRSIQERCEIGELVQRLDVSIDRLTVIWDTDTGSLRRIFKNLKQAISTRVDSFEIYDNVRDDVFTLAKDFNEYDSINIIFFQLSTYGGEQLIRIDFNPNTLKEFDGMKVWRQLMYFARLNSLTVRLSRFDLAFDIFNRPEIVNLQHIKGGVTHKVFYGRGGELETKYWGSSGSNVQVRLYDKNKEIIAHKREEKLDLDVNPFWWRLEFQLRTKAIGEEMVQDIMSRLDNFGFYKLDHIRVDQRAFTIIFLNNPELLSLAFPKLKSDSIKKKKTRVRKLLREETNQFAEELKEVLIQNLPKLNTELQLLVGEFLTLENQ
jgi:replication initiator protein